MVSAAIMILTAVGGCAPRVEPAPDIGPDAVHWPYWPLDMRVHPLTRLVRDPDTVLIEARIEFLDREGHTTKCFGKLRLDLREGPDGGSEISVNEWNVRLDEIETNRLHFDEVTRTYLLKLEIEPEDLPEEPVLYVWYLSPDGGMMEDSAPIRTR